jgi:hypothetical protein
LSEKGKVEKKKDELTEQRGLDSCRSKGDHLPKRYGVQKLEKGSVEAGIPAVGKDTFLPSVPAVRNRRYG